MQVHGYGMMGTDLPLNEDQQVEKMRRQWLDNEVVRMMVEMDLNKRKE